ncbi:hypothetical protein [Nonomuraea sp. NPDC002799]
MRRRTRTWMVAAVVLPLAACSIPGAARPTPGATTSAPASVTRSAPGAVREPAVQPPPAGDKPLAGATFRVDERRSAEVAVMSLKRRGRLLDLVLRFTPRSEGETYISVERFTGAGPSAITLVDNVRLKRYLIVRDSEGRPLAPPYWIIKVGAASLRTYTFPAPEAGVTELDVSIGAEPPFRDVPVTS